MWTVRYFRSKQYNWSGISQQPSLIAKAKRGLLQFTPYSWDNFEWGVFSSPKRLVHVGGVCGGGMCVGGWGGAGGRGARAQRGWGGQLVDPQGAGQRLL